ncbi:hypothetical protein [Novipirellula sp.]|uniref:hypothetical protein n=1 Tax=Novipirellula sp. TaxID=2795430 RepID=UPI00356967B1
MTDTSASRPLRFEQLETRSLLAGGILVFDLSFTASQSDNFQDDTVGQLASSASSAFQAQRQTQLATLQEASIHANHVLASESLGNSEQSDRGGANGIDRNHHAAVSSRQGSSYREDTSYRQDTTVAQATQSTTPTTLGISSTVASQTNPGINDVANDRRNVNAVLPQNNNGLVIPSAVDAILASLQPLEQNDTSLDDQEALQAVETVSTISAENADAVADIATTTENELEATSFLSTAEIERTDSDSVDDLQSGLIPSDSSFHLHPLQSLSDSEEGTWQLDDGILPRLQRHLHSTLRATPQVVDMSLLDWFSGPGGLIDLQRANLPSRIGVITGDAIKVQLESTIGYHRCLDLIAAGVVEPISGPLLDSILASIESMTSEETQPVSDPPPLRISKLAYPAGAAIVAGSIAIAARRKHKSPPSDLDQDGLF